MTGSAELAAVDHRIALPAAAEALGVPSLTFVDALRSGNRTDVWRVTDGETSYVVKAYRDPASGTWRRESAGLLVARGDGAPRLVAAVVAPPLVVMEDLGQGVSLADLLLGRDAGHASLALGRWAEALAHVHRRTAGRRAEYDEALTRDPSDAPVRTLPDDIATGVEQLARAVAAHGLPSSAGVQESVRRLVEPLLDPDGHVLSPGDTCPDNNHDDGQRLRLLDFEFAEFRHPAWDVAYLQVPFPSCWCAWAIPGRPARAALDVYRAAAGEAVPLEEREVGIATLAWCLFTTGWFIGDALDVAAGEGTDGTDRRPGRQPLILNRLRLAARSPADADLASYAGELAHALERRWGYHRLQLAPAFR